MPSKLSSSPLAVLAYLVELLSLLKFFFISKFIFWIFRCDVRDVALAHIRAAFIPEAAGKRHIISSHKKLIKMKAIADCLHKEFGPKGYDVTREEELSCDPDPNMQFDNSRMINVLQISPFDLKNTIIDMAYSLIKSGAIKLPKWNFSLKKEGEKKL